MFSADGSAAQGIKARDRSVTFCVHLPCKREGKWRGKEAGALCLLSLGRDCDHPHGAASSIASGQTHGFSEDPSRHQERPTGRPLDASQSFAGRSARIQNDVRCGRVHRGSAHRGTDDVSTVSDKHAHVRNGRALVPVQAVVVSTARTAAPIPPMENCSRLFYFSLFMLAVLIGALDQPTSFS